MSLLLALTAGAGVSVDLDVTDASDTLAALACILLEVSLSVTDSGDTLAAGVSIADTPEEAPVSLGGRNKLFDVASRRVRANLSVDDDSDQLYAVAKVAQVLRVAKVQILPSPRTIACAVLDDADSVGSGCAMSWPECDALQSTAKGTWPERHMVTLTKRKLISSRYEAETI